MIAPLMYRRREAQDIKCAIECHPLKAVATLNVASFPTRIFLRYARTPDKMVSQLVGDVFGMLCIHTPNYDMCSKSLEKPRRAALPLDES
jgi:hypothetical protein